MAIVRRTAPAQHSAEEGHPPPSGKDEPRMAGELFPPRREEGLRSRTLSVNWSANGSKEPVAVCSDQAVKPSGQRSKRGPTGKNGQKSASREPGKEGEKRVESSLNVAVRPNQEGRIGTPRPIGLAEPASGFLALIRHEAQWNSRPTGLEPRLCRHTQPTLGIVDQY
jgi:hypothetical protein